MRNFWNRRQADLERELRAHRPRTRADFVETLAAEVRSRPTERSRIGRVGLAIAMSGLILVALASFGGIGYASSAVSHAVNKPTVAKKAVNVSSPSAAQAQYGGFKPPTKPAQPTGGTGGGTGGGNSGGGTSGGQASTGGQAGGTEGTSASSGAGGTSSNLPFTGLALWMPLAIGLGLIATGLVLRTRGRRRDSGAQS